MRSWNEVVGKRSEVCHARELKRSPVLNLSPVLKRSFELPADEPEPESAPPGHRDSPLELPEIAPARDEKLAPAPDAEADPTRSAQLPPSALVPQVREPPPYSSELKAGSETAVPIDPAPDATPTVVVAYSPIVCASARAAMSAIAAIKTTAAVFVFVSDLFSLTAPDLR